jgi:hypothetical protein
MVIKNVDAAIATLTSARHLISSTTTGVAIIINATDKKGTWYTYNDVAPLKATTQFQSYMGPHTAVPTHSMGWGAMTTYLDNAGPPMMIQRGGVYVYNGDGLSMFLNLKN